MCCANNYIITYKPMAKVIAPFQIQGTLDDLNFVVADGINYVRKKGKTDKLPR